MVTRKDILTDTINIVCKDRDDAYGSPENNFATISDLWNVFLRKKLVSRITDADVAAMMCLLKISRIASGAPKLDNWIDLAGYAACGGELQMLDTEDKTDE